MPTWSLSLQNYRQSKLNYSMPDFPLKNLRILYAHSLNARMEKSDLRIQFSLDPRYQDFLGDTIVKEVLGQQVRVASLANVVRGKVWAWIDPRRRLSKRKKDELDLIRILEMYPESRSLIPAEISRQVDQG